MVLALSRAGPYRRQVFGGFGWRLAILSAQDRQPPPIHGAGDACSDIVGEIGFASRGPRQGVCLTIPRHHFQGDCADMKNMLQEFKDFINKGDVVMIAVGLVMALTFKAIIDAFVEGIINPIIAAIFGETSYLDMGFSINGSFISIGLVIGAIINFVAVAIILFFIVKAYNRWKAEDDDAAPTEVELLTEIRDALRNR